MRSAGTGPGLPGRTSHMRWLRSLRFDDAVLAGDVDRLSLRGRDARRAPSKRYSRRLSRRSRTPVTRRRSRRCRCFRGIDTLSAAGLCAEVGDWPRFRPKQLSGFLGVVPSERTSDTKRRQGAITKTGSAHARRLLVEAAHQYRHHPAIGDGLAKRQDDQDPRVIEVSWRAQRRLHGRWRILHSQRRKPAGVVAIACARGARRVLLGGRHPPIAPDLTYPGGEAAGTRARHQRASRSSQAKQSAI